jgi:N-acetylmuramoyl-L-alanine amidase
VRGASAVDRIQLSPNVEPRLGGKTPLYLILHYTGMVSSQAAVDWLCNPASKVSCHYLVGVEGEIVQMVDEELRAWHAGVGSWQGEIDINSVSIGIEIQNAGHSEGSPAFPEAQMQSVAKLSREIMERHAISPSNVLAHSDIAPGRKIDPGEHFDWDWLAANGVGISVKPVLGGNVMDITLLQENLAKLGYGLNVTGVNDAQTVNVVEAFQRHHRRKKVDGHADGETCDAIRRLIAIHPA